jgi:hypothetical protein
VFLKSEVAICPGQEVFVSYGFAFYLGGGGGGGAWWCDDNHDDIDGIGGGDDGGDDGIGGADDGCGCVQWLWSWSEQDCA